MLRMLVRVTVLAVLSVTPPGSTVVRAQDGRGAPRPTRLDLGFDMSIPGTPVSIPILLEVPDGIEIGRVVDEIAFPSGVLSFDGTSTSVADASVTTRVAVDPGNPDRSVLTVTVTSPQAMRTGTVASVVFKVAKDAAAESIRLGNVPRAFTAGPSPQPITPIEGREGEIQLSATAPATTCLFYMH